MRLLLEERVSFLAVVLIAGIVSAVLRLPERLSSAIDFVRDKVGAFVRRPPMF